MYNQINFNRLGFLHFFTAMQEKRRVHRFKMELPAWFCTSDSDDELSIGTTVDISATGICFVSKTELAVDQELVLQIKIPSEEVLFIRGKVMWVKEDFRSVLPEYRIGFKINDAPQNDELRFVRFFAMKMLDFFKANVNPYVP